MSICEDNCDFTAYDNAKKKAVCSCGISVNNIPFIKDIKIDKEKLKSNFIHIKNIANVEVIKCYKLFFSKNIKNNIGFYIISLIIILLIVTIFIFYFHEYNSFNKKIKEIFDIKNLEKSEELNKGSNNEINQDNEKESIEEIINNKIESENKINSIKLFQNKEKASKLIKNKDENKTKDKKMIKLKKEITNSSRKINVHDSKEKFNENENNNHKNFTINNINKKISPNKLEVKKQEYNEIMSYNNSEINDLSYDKAIEFDKRTYVQYYISLLMTKHLLIFSFIYNDDYKKLIYFFHFWNQLYCEWIIF